MLDAAISRTGCFVTLVERRGALGVGAGVGGFTIGDCGVLDGTVGVVAGVFAGVFSLCRFSVSVEGVG